MMNKNTLKTAGMVLTAGIVVVLAYFFIFVRQTGEYSVAYLSSGEMYIGRLSTFPRLKLSDVYILQLATVDQADPTKNTFQISPVQEALWAPDYLYLNKDQVIFMGPLSEASTIYQTLKKPASTTPAPIEASATTTQ